MIYIAGGAGVPNFGDELMAKYWLDEVQHNSDVTFSGIRGKVLRSLFSQRYPNVKFTGGLHACLAHGPANFWGAFEFGTRIFSWKNKHLLGEERERLLAAKVFHLHGGGYINTKWPKHAFYFGLALALKEKTGCKIAATGLGLTPILAPPAKLVEKFGRSIDAFDVLEVRDEDSYHFLRKYSSNAMILNGLDDVFLQSQGITPGAKTLHVSLYPGEEFGRMADRIPSRFVDGFDRHLFWLCTPRDAEGYMRVAKRFPFFQLATIQDLVFAPLPVSPNDFMIAARFHPHLLAARKGAHGTFRAPTDYYKVKHGSVVALGSPFTETLMRDLNPPEDKLSDIIKLDADRVAKKRRNTAPIYAA